MGDDRGKRGPDGYLRARFAGIEVLDVIGDKWTALVVYAISRGYVRPGELRREIAGISKRMLTHTLRKLERDGLVSRITHVAPTAVEYALTDLGQSLQDVLSEICHWAESNLPRIEAARYDWVAAGHEEVPSTGSGGRWPTVRN